MICSQACSRSRAIEADSQVGARTNESAGAGVVSVERRVGTRGTDLDCSSRLEGTITDSVSPLGATVATVGRRCCRLSSSGVLGSERVGDRVVQREYGVQTGDLDGPDHGTIVIDHYSQRLE